VGRVDLNRPMATPTDDFADRLARARKGDELAWQALFRSVSGRVAGFLVSRGAPDAEGVAGDVFLDVVRSIRRFEGDERAFRSWVLTIAHRRLVDALRSRRRLLERATDPADLEQSDPVDTESEALGLVRAAEARRLLDHLTVDQADVLALRMYGELTLPEIAEHLGKPLTAVTSLQTRALDRLRRMLESGEILL